MRILSGVTWTLKRGSVTRIFASGFFHGSSSPKPLKLIKGHFEFVSKIRGDIRKSKCTTGINDTGVKGGQRCPNKIIKIFCLETFSICHRCQQHRTLSCENIREFPKKFETALMGYSGTWGKLIHEKIWSRKSWGPFKIDAHNLKK